MKQPIGAFNFKVFNLHFTQNLFHSLYKSSISNLEWDKIRNKGCTFYKHEEVEKIIHIFETYHTDPQIGQSKLLLYFKLILFGIK